MESWVLSRIADLCRELLAKHDAAVREEEECAKETQGETEAEAEAESTRQQQEEEEGEKDNAKQEQEEEKKKRDQSVVAQLFLNMLRDGEVAVCRHYCSLAEAVLPLCHTPLPLSEVVHRAQNNEFLSASRPARAYFKTVWAPLFKRQAKSISASEEN